MVQLSMQEQMTATEHSSAGIHYAWVYLGQGFSNVLGAGTWSVSFFFVLSGFILFYNYGDARNGPFHMRKFWVARFARIYPVYAMGMLVFAPFLLRGWAYNPQMDSHSLVTGGVLSGTLLQSWFWRYATFWNGPGWSMSAEAFFYAMFPLLLLTVRKASSSWKLLAVMLVCWIVSVLKVPLVHSMIDHGWFSGAKDNPDAFTAIADYNPLARIPEFLAGAALGRLMILRGGSELRGTRLTVTTFLAMSIGLLAAALGKDCPWYLAVSGGLTPIFAVVIWNLTVDSSILARLLAWRPLVFLGEASYSVYILHLPLEHWFGYVVRKLAHSPDGLLDVPTYGMLAAYLVFMLGVCSFTYLFIELPARDFIRLGFRRRRMIAAPAAETRRVAVPSA